MSSEDGRMEMGHAVEHYEAGEREYARDRFAAAALTGLLAMRGSLREISSHDAHKEMAWMAFDIADAMVTERERRQGNG